MRKIASVLTLLLMVVVPVMAWSTWTPTPKFPNLRLVKKDPTTWEPLPAEVCETWSWGGHPYTSCRRTGHPEIQLASGWFGGITKYQGYGLEPNTRYTLIYYGDETHNDEWPYATCIETFRTDRRGSHPMTHENFDRLDEFLTDSVGQKFWVVPTRDLDCAAGRFIDWNPAEYFFEWNTV